MIDLHGLDLILRDMSTSHSDNFDFLRFVAAVMVWYEHCYALYGHIADTITGQIPFGALGVGIFFIISGYFVTASYQNHRRLWPFIRNRALRILPALFIVVLLSVFVLGPCVTSLSTHDYFQHNETWGYLKSLLIFPLQYNLPGVFTNQPLIAVNGSLWTLQYEVRCYAAVALLGMLMILRPRVVLIIFIGLWLGRIYSMCANIDLLPHISLFDRWSWSKLELSIHLNILFASGALLYLARERIALKKEYFVLAVLVLLVSLTMQDTTGKLLSDIALPYIIMYIGFAKLPLLSRFSKYGDFSYGMYLYAFPMQQLTFYMLGAHYRFITLVIVSFMLTLACAVTSWYCIEKPALSLKK